MTARPPFGKQLAQSKPVMMFEPGPAQGFTMVRRSLSAQLRLGVSGFALGAMATLGAGAGQAQEAAAPVALGVNNIVIDGRSQTSVSVLGSVTSITTETVSNNTGYNSFLQFEQASGTTVNLYLPKDTGTLVNIVRDGPVVVEGVLNAYKNGEIGGNVYFSDSHGFILGDTGVINVGSLTVNTPTDQFLESVIGADGSIDQAAAARLMRGEIPISPDGAILISGQINAENGITLDGQSVMLTGPSGARVTAKDLTQRQRFEATVNASGLSEGGAMVSRNGVISIVAKGSATIRGRVKVGADADGAGGKIKITTGGDLTLAPTAALSADGAGKSGIGGTIVVYAGTSLYAQTGAMVSARGAGSGAGGFVELSGKTAEIGSVKLDLLSDSGAGGSLLIDPVDVTITAGNAILNPGVNTAILADRSITIASGGSIDTSLLNGASGTITLTAPILTVAAGGLLNAQAKGSGTAGSVMLNAVGEQAQISISGEIRGDDVTLLATSTAAPLSVLASLPTAKAAIAIDGGQITATGKLTATATASTAAAAAGLPIGVGVTNIAASVDIGGGAVIVADRGDFSSTATASSDIATKSLLPADSSADAAVAVSRLTSSATTHIGSADLTLTGDLSLTAVNTVTSHAIASPQAAAFGASVAVSLVDITTATTVDEQGYISAANLSLTAQTTSDIVVTAAAASGGATEPQAGSQAASYLADPAFSSAASTSEGKVSVVGALAISKLSSQTLASIASDRASAIAGDVTLTSATANSADVRADGTAVKSGVGVGVALGINIASVSNTALVGGAGLAAGSLTLDAAMTAGGSNSFTTQATSGAGGSRVGVAGSLAVNLIDTQSLATLSATGPIVIAGGDVSLMAQDETGSHATAVPDTGGATGEVGVGASVATNIVSNRTLASLADATTLTTAGALTLSAQAVRDISTTAQAGASGGVALTPALALSLVNNTTAARLGTHAAAQTAAGSIRVLASQSATETTIASGKAAGSKAAIGAAVAIAVVNDTVSATTLRDLDAGLDITLRSWGASQNSLEATASASGAEAADDTGKAKAGQDSDVDATITKNLTHGSDQQSRAGVGDADQQAASAQAATDEDSRSASTSEGKVTVAAAVGVNVQTSSVTAGVPDGRSLVAGGTVTIQTANNTFGSVSADGTAAGESPAALAIGAAVAINVVHSSNAATLGNGRVQAKALVISAMKGDVRGLMAAGPGAPLADSYSTRAVSGAAGSKVGLAGALALNLIDTESQASIATAATLTLQDGAVSLTSDNQTAATAAALPVAGTSGGSIGIGASAAINILANRSLAEIGDDVTLTGAADLSLQASAAHQIETTAEAGAAGGVGLVPVLALALVTNTASAQIGSNASALQVSGGLSVAAEQSATETTTASATAAGDKAAIGVALSLALISDKVTVSTGRAITASSGDVSFTATGRSTGSLGVTASAKGAAGADDKDQATDGEGSVDDRVSGQFAQARAKQSASKIGTADQQADTDKTASQNHSAGTSEGKLSVAAAAGVNVVTSSVTAQMADGKDITAGGRLTVQAINATDGAVTADASAAGSAIAIGAAAAVNAITQTNIASLGAANYRANGVTVSALKADPAAAAQVDSFAATAKSGAGGSNVGIAGALALNLIGSQSSALVSGGAVVDAGSGASVVSADQAMLASASAAPLDDSTTSGGKVGIGASAALNLITTAARAEIEDGAVFDKGAGLSVAARSDVSTLTDAKAGSEGGIAVDAVVALALLDIDTIARIGSGAAIDTAGDVTLLATSTGENTATGSGESKAGKVGVGAAVAVISGAGAQSTDISNTSVTSAEVARDLTAQGLSIVASSARSYEAYATASAGGGKDKDASQTSSAESTKTLDSTKNYQRGTDGSDQKTGKGGAKVTVAAAVGVAAAQDLVSAKLGAVTLSLSQDLTVSATNETNIATRGDGTASGAEIGVAVGVALSISNNTAQAQIADGATVLRAGDVTVSATSSQNMAQVAGKTDFLNGLAALAYAGASSKKVSVAGALAVDVSNTTTLASIGDSVSIGGGARVGSVNVTADNSSRMSAKSTSLARGGKVGVGASVAVVVSDNSYTANIGAGSTIKSQAMTLRATSAKIPPAAAFNFTDLQDFQTNIVSQPLFGAGNYYVEAIGGAQASNVAVQGSFAVMLFADKALAAMGQSLTVPTLAAVSLIDSNGQDIAVLADSGFDAKALSGAVALSSKVGVGLTSAVIVNSNQSSAQLGVNTRLTHAGTVEIMADAEQSIDVIGISAAGGSSLGVAGVASVLVADNVTEALIGAGSEIAAVGAVTISANSDFDALSVAGGLGIGGSAGLGASASVVTLNTITRAAIADGSSAATAVKISQAGALNVLARAAERAKSYVVAGGASQSVGVGAGAGVYVLETSTQALIGKYTQIGQTGAVGAINVTARDDSTLDTFPGAVGGGGSVGAGAGVGVGVLTKTVTAEIGDAAAVTGSDVLVQAQASEAANILAISAGIGGSAGLAGAVAVYTIENTTTARIGESATIFADGTVAVLAQDFASVDSFAGALAASGSAGVGASVGIVIVDNKTYASIADLAAVTALGAGSGISYVADFDAGFSAFADNFQGADLPDWDASTGLTASNASSAAQVGLTATEARDTGLSLLTKTRTASPAMTTAHGVVVNAAASNSVRSLQIGFGAAGAAAVALSGNVPVLTSDTQASIGAAQINTMAGVAAANQGVTVAAASDTYDLGIAGAAAVGGGVGAGAGLSVAVVNTTTKATVASGAEMQAVGDVAVTAMAQEDFAAFSAAAAGGGSVALAGGVGVIALTNVTTAELAGKTIAGGNVQVLADDQTRVATMDGSVSVGLGTAGVGGAIGVLVVNKTTSATLAANAEVTALANSANSFTAYRGTDMTTPVLSARGLNVAATSGESNLTIAASAAGGLYAGISGVVTVQIQNITTSASIGANALINQHGLQGIANSDQDVFVTARDTAVSTVYAGGLAVGFVGLAGTVDVGVIKTTTSATLGDGVVLSAKRNVSVSALSNKAGNSVIVAGAAGVVSVGAAIAVYDYGNGIAPGGVADDKMAEASGGKVRLQDITDQAQGQTNDQNGDGVSSLFASADTDSRVKSASDKAQAARGAVTLETAPASGLLVPAGTSANIGRITLSAGGAVAVRSLEQVNTSFAAGAAAAGIAGVGAGIVVQSVDTTNTAQISGAAQIVAAGLAVDAKTLHSLQTRTVVGAAGGYGLAAAVSVVSDESDTYAFINGATVQVAGDVAVNVTSGRSIDTQALGLSFGAVGAAGVSVATSTLGGATKAALGADASGAQANAGVDIGSLAQRSGSVHLGAVSTDQVSANTTAAGAGVGFALQGAVALGEVDTQVGTQISDAKIYTQNDINSTVTAANGATTAAGGAALAGGLAAGVSLAHSTVKAALSTQVDTGSVLDGGSVLLSATISGATSDAKAIAVAGALIGLAGSDAQSLNQSSAQTLVSDSSIKATGAVAVTAGSATQQSSEATGYVFGLAALGSNQAKSGSATVTRAVMTDMAGVSGASLSLAATGADNNTAVAVAGSGGVVAGAASLAETSSQSTTEALVVTTAAAQKFLIDISTGTASISASHTALFGGSVDSTQASLVGASGASLSHLVNATVNAGFGDYAYLRAANLNIRSASYAHNFFLGEAGYALDGAGAAPYNADDAGWNVNSGSGGLANGPAGQVKVNITQNTASVLGQAADVRLLLPSVGVSALQIEAYNEVISHQKVKLDSAGLVALASAVVELNAVQNATISLGDSGTLLVDVGDIHIGAWNQSDMDARSSATTYGVAGAPTGHAYANLTVANLVSIGREVRIEATDGLSPPDGSLPTNATVSIYAGQSPSGRRSANSLRGIIDLYNNSAIPIPGAPDAQANLSNSALIRQGTTSNINPPPLRGILAAGDIFIGADRGDNTLVAVGTGTDIYRQALAAIASAVSELFGGDAVSFDYHGGTVSNTGSALLTLEGLVATGLQRAKSLTIDYIAGCTDFNNLACLATSGSIGESGITRESITLDNSIIIQRLSQLELLKANTEGDTVALGAYQNEINFLQQKLIALGLGEIVAGQFQLKAFAAGKSQQQLLIDQKTVSEDLLAQVATGFTNQATVVDDALQTSIATTYFDGTANDYKTYVSTARGQIAALAAYQAALNTPATLPDGKGGATTNPAYAAAQDLISNYNGYSGNVSFGLILADIYYGTIVNTVAANDTLQTEIAARIALIKDPASSSAQVSTAQSELTAKLNQVVLNNATIKTASNNLNSQMGSINTSLNNLAATAKGSAALPGAISTNLAILANGKNFVSDWNIALGTTNASISDRVAVLVGATPPGDGYTVASFTSLASGLAATIGALALQIPTASTATATAPATPSITVKDLTARLGNIYLSGDAAVGNGSGILSAPGNAEIILTNNTAASLQINSITMPSYDAGHVRMNGVLVDSVDEVAAFSVGLAASTKFAQVITGLTSSRPVVTISNTYNPTSGAYPLGLAPPDLVIKGTINNPEGAVGLTSEFGNIYVQGAINAGSVNILARNGDFVSSYVNGFNHVGGDPASFNSPTQSAERGIGIVANGAVSISARYLNINSTVQSGIVDQSLSLAAAPRLTAVKPSDIGVLQSVVDTAKTAYRAALTAGGTPAATATVINAYGRAITVNFNPNGLDTTALKAAITSYNAAVLQDPAANPAYVVPVAGGGAPQLINIKDFLSGTGLEPRLEFSVAEANAYKADAGNANGLVYQVIKSASDTIGASYDVDQAKYVVNSAEVHGGFIQLYGQILNTSSTGGQLNVLDGFGRINVTNSSAIPLVLQALNAGADSSGVAGRGTAGVIDITDITHVDATSRPSLVDVKHTVYTRDYTPGNSRGTIMVATQTGTLDTTTGLPSYTGIPAVTVADSSGSLDGHDRSATYATTANQRYIWTVSTDYRLQVSVQTKDRQLFGSSKLSIGFKTNFSSIGTPNVLAETRLAGGTYLSQDYTPTGTTTFINDGAGNKAILVTDPTNYTQTANSTLGGQALVSGDFSFSDPRSSYTQTGQSKRSCNWWTLCIDSTVTTTYLLDQFYTTIQTNSLKADNPIAINFIGYNTPSIMVTSPTDVELNAAVTAHNGTVTIAATGAGHSILSSTDSAVVTGSRINLTAGGSLGSSSYALNLRMDGAASGNGALVAAADLGIVNLTAPNGVVIEKVTAAGDPLAGYGRVNINASSGIQSAKAAQFFTPSPVAKGLIEAPRVILTSANGAIGTLADPLRVNSGAALGSRVFGDAVNPDPYYGLSAYASGDIGIAAQAWGSPATAYSGNADGTVLVDQVLSLGGNVLISSSGQILDNNPTEVVDTRSYTELLGHWNALGLVRGTAENAAKLALAQSAFETGRNVEYQAYWSFRSSQPDGGAVYDPSFTYRLDPTSSRYRALVAQGVDIAGYEAEQTLRYHALNDRVGGLTDSYSASYVYLLSDHPEEAAKLAAGSDWSERQLAFALSPGALKTVTGTNPVLKAPNVAGRSVTLNAGVGIGETVGAEFGPALAGVLIPADIAPSALSDAQKIALATAERSDITIIVSRISAPAAGADQATLDAYAQASAAGILNATTIVALGKDEAAMTAAELAAYHAAQRGLVRGSDLTIQVLTKRPLNFDATTGLNVTVTGATGAMDHGTAYLASRGNGLLQAISVPGETRIKTVGPIANVGSGVVATGNLILESSQGGIGSGINPFDPAVRFGPMRLSPLTGASVTARAQADIDLAITGTALIDTIYSPNNITVTGDAGLQNANDDGLINILGTTVVLTATNGTIGSAARSLNLGVNFGGGITAAAPSGAIYLNGPQSQNFVISSAQAPNGISLSAAGAAVVNGPLHSAGNILMTVGDKLSLTALSEVVSTIGDIITSAGSLQMFNGASLRASVGAISLTTTRGEALVTGLSAAGDVTVTSAGHVLAGSDPSRAFDIETTTTSALIKITAALGIGDQTRNNSPSLDWPYDAAAQSNLITAKANPLILKTTKLDLTATKGDLFATTPLDIAEAKLTTGSGTITVSAAKSLQVQSAQAGADINLTSVADLGVDSLTAGQGGAGGVNLQTTAGALRVGRATSSGNQLWRAQGNIGFDQITTTAALPAAGDVDLASSTGAINGGSVAAAGSVVILAPQDLSLVDVIAGQGGAGGVNLQTTAGALRVGRATSSGNQLWRAQGNIGFDQITTMAALPAAGDVDLASSTGAINGGSVAAAGSVRMMANGIDFNTITAGTDTYLNSSRDIFGTALVTAGDADLIAGSDSYAGVIRIGSVTARNMSFDATGALILPDLNVAEALVLRGGTVDARITQVPSGPNPLRLTLTGGRGSVGRLARVQVDAPAGLSIQDLVFDDTTLTTTAKNLRIANGFVPGSLWISTPLQRLSFDNRTPAPHYAADVQFFAQSYRFYLDLQSYYSLSDAFVVKYELSPESANQLYGAPSNGASLVRDTIRAMRNSIGTNNGPGTVFWRMDQTLPPGSVVLEGEQIMIDGVVYSIGTIGAPGASVQLGSNQ